MPLRALTDDAEDALSGVAISIHSAPAGTDSAHKLTRFWSEKFQSTVPLRALTGGTLVYDTEGAISIHSAPAGTDVRRSAERNRGKISIHSAPAGTDSKII